MVNRRMKYTYPFMGQVEFKKHEQYGANGLT